MVALENYTNLFTTPVLNKLGHLFRAITLRIVNSTPFRARRQYHDPFQAHSISLYPLAFTARPHITSEV